jgi:hypothetical protein
MLSHSTRISRRATPCHDPVYASARKERSINRHVLHGHANLEERESRSIWRNQLAKFSTPAGGV